MRYWIDSRDRIADVDETWLPFAIANGAPDLTPKNVCGRPLEDFISDPTTAHLWTQILARAREGVPLQIRIRCDAPDRRRLFRLDLARDGLEHIRVQSETLLEEERSPVGLFEVHREPSADQVCVCSWCKQLLVAAGDWCEVEVALVKMDLLERLRLPAITHGICSSCAARVRAEAGLA